jgi:N-acetylated-alpha-linked acidic dipeptidase
LHLALITAASTACAVWVFAAAVAADPAPMMGFTVEGAAAERSLERRFDERLDPKYLRGWLESMSAEPNHVGSPHDRQNADFMLQQFRQWGWDAHIETFQVLYPTPVKERLEMMAPQNFVASLHEPAVAGDRTSSISSGLPPYVVYGADGDITGELVYVNYGMPDDYRELARRGISVKGRVVIARYGGGWRGTKPRVAYEQGAIGCIIYSDPYDEGYFRGDVYPRGGWRPDASVQRGSVMDLAIYPGDPLTPGVGASQTAKRLTIAEATTLPKIPVLPISAADAAPLLAALDGPVAPAGWRGALPMTYHIGAGPATVHLVVQSEWTLKPIYDVIAKIEGSAFPDEWVVRGNHHDGWVFGAADPLAGNAALMAEAKAIGALLKTGWRPRRTLIYAGWDAEEPGLIGSTEWAELHGAELQRHAVLYVNSDVNARGFLVSGGSHSLQHLVNEVASGIRDPQTGVSVRDRLRAKLSVDQFSNAAAADSGSASPSDDLPLAALGSGTDFTVFLQHLGITTLDLYYSGEDNGDGSWHSIYDSFDSYIRFGDPQFAYGIVEAQTVGHVVLRVADAAVLPLRISDFAAALQGYDKELHALAEQAKHHAAELARLLASHSFELAADPTQKVDAPAPEGPVPTVSFAAFDKSVERLNRTAAAYDQAYARLAANGLRLTPEKQARLNSLLRGLEQSLTFPGGLPGRPWFKHMIYAPGLSTGYAPKTVPGVREAIEQGRWNEAESYIAITAHVIDGYCDQVDAARALISVPQSN